LALAVALAGCNRTSPSASGEKPAKIAFVQAHMTSTFRTQMIEGAQAAAKKAGVELTVFNSNNEVVKQNEAIETYSGQGYDVIIVAAIEKESVLPAIRAAKEKGVKIIAVDTIIDDAAVSAQVGVDNAAGGKTMGEYVIKYAKDNQVTPKVGVVGALNSEIQNVRADSFAGVLSSNGGSIVQTVDGQNRQEVAIASAENLFTAYKDLPIAYATGEPALVGTLAAAKSQKVQDKVKIFGWDLSQETVAAIEAGTVVAVAYQPAAGEGKAAIETAIKLHNGDSVPRSQLIPIEIVTKDNVAQYRSIFN
jgi:ribose transport system substrate-binding protein